MKIKVFRDKYEDALERKVNEFLTTPTPMKAETVKDGDYGWIDLPACTRKPINPQIKPALADGEMMVVVTYD